MDSSPQASDYAMRVFWYEADREYVATFEAFPGISCLAPDPRQAASEALDLLDEVITDMIADGEPLPPPDKVTFPSGRITLRLPRSLHRTLTHLAEQEGVSLNTLILTSLAERVGHGT